MYREYSQVANSECVRRTFRGERAPLFLLFALRENCLSSITENKKKEEEGAEKSAHNTQHTQDTHSSSWKRDRQAGEEKRGEAFRTPGLPALFAGQFFGSTPELT